MIGARLAFACRTLASEFFFFLFFGLWYLFIEGKGRRFSGGFDINVFEKVHRTGMS